jgi:hypothetical protein
MIPRIYISYQLRSLLNMSSVGNLGWSFVGEVSSQKLRARTAGLAAGASVIFGLTFNTSLPVIRERPCLSLVTKLHILISAYKWM